ncbi:MAG: hypothetical protein ED557_14140 [Balneola sp.]|nr:MAG: hypothetical protein ED557_14140 [Balneola sp.]
MIEYHGWITLRFSDYDDGVKKQSEFLKAFKKYLTESHPIIDEKKSKFIDYNGLEAFIFSSQHNHKDQSVFYPIQILKWLAENGPGSYGTLYILDDEDHNDEIDNSNIFKLWVLKRGKVYETNDQNLSPYIPECEKEYDPKNPPIDYDFE